MSGSIGRSKPTFIVYLIIFPLVHFLITVFVAGNKVFRWKDTALEFLVYPESETVGFSSFNSGLFFVVGARERFLHTCILSIPLKTLPLKFNKLCL